MRKILLKDWAVSSGEYAVKASVPGDIHIDLFNAGLIPDPYIGENYKDSEWVGRQDWDYKTIFSLSEVDFESEEILLSFKGIDLFAEIILNGKALGKVDNAFLSYSYSCKETLRVGENELVVRMSSTLNAMDKMDATGYFSIFNDKRIFVRKPQCHFGWDWAPKICAYGIIGDVSLDFVNAHRINDVRVVTDIKGNATFHVETNYTPKPLFGPNDEILKPGDSLLGDKIVVTLAKEPGSKETISKEIELSGQKSFLSLSIEEPRLWWPAGYGEAALYEYTVTLIRDGKVVDTKSGRLGFREIALKEEPKENNLLGMKFEINGKEVFLKGSNWVPPECFTGVMSEKRYKSLIKLAKNANMNLLRVWGGGFYETDEFYDICDELGLMVWQDFALACADIPEDKPDFMNNFLREAEFQVKRLRNHPSLIFWCGGNEKTGTYGNLISKGDFLVNYVLCGLVNHLDGTRPYRRQSPHSYTDIGNDKTSGDSHHGCMELALDTGVDSYRQNIAKSVVPFVSECALLGPSSLETMKKFLPEENLWPMDEVWKDRLMENPYAAILLDFPHRELFYAEALYGKVNSLEDFIPKGMSAHAEAFRAECEYTRAHRSTCGAFLNWMFDDIWPSGTWATVDYYEEPKQVYYQARRSFAPLLVSFYEDAEGLTHVFMDNQSNEDYKGILAYGTCSMSGQVKERNEVNIDKLGDNTLDIPYAKMNHSCSDYLFAEYAENGSTKRVLYSPNMWRGDYVVKDIPFKAQLVNEHEVIVTLGSPIFVKSAFVHLKDNFAYFYSDNYVDLEPGKSVNIALKSSRTIDIDSIKVEGLVCR